MMWTGVMSDVDPPGADSPSIPLAGSVAEVVVLVLVLDEEP